MRYPLRMLRQPAPVAVPIAAYIGQRIRLLAICDDCLNVAALDPVALVEQHGHIRRRRCFRSALNTPAPPLSARARSGAP